MKKSNNTGKIVGALVAGAVVGAALGVLFAPDKGSNTRSKIAGGVKDLADDAKKKIKDQVDNLKDRAEGAMEDLSNQTKQPRA